MSRSSVVSLGRGGSGRRMDFFVPWMPMQSRDKFLSGVADIFLVILKAAGIFAVFKIFSILFDGDT